MKPEGRNPGQQFPDCAALHPGYELPSSDFAALDPGYTILRNTR